MTTIDRDQGFVPKWRSLGDHPALQRARPYALYWKLAGRAASYDFKHKTKRGEITLHVGQSQWSIRKIALFLDCSKESAAGVVRQLIAAELITMELHGWFTIFTVTDFQGIYLDFSVASQKDSEIPNNPSVSPQKDSGNVTVCQCPSRRTRSTQINSLSSTPNQKEKKEEEVILTFPFTEEETAMYSRGAGITIEEAFEIMWGRYPIQGRQFKPDSKREFVNSVQSHEDAQRFKKAFDYYLKSDAVRAGHVLRADRFFSQWNVIADNAEAAQQQRMASPQIINALLEEERPRVQRAHPAQLPDAPARKELPAASDGFDQEAAFAEAWASYPRPEGRKEAFQHFQMTVRSEQDFERLKTAVRNYRGSGVEGAFIMTGAKFFTRWDEWVNYAGVYQAPQVTINEIKRKNDWTAKRAAVQFDTTLSDEERREKLDEILIAEKADYAATPEIIVQRPTDKVKASPRHADGEGRPNE